MVKGHFVSSPSLTEQAFSDKSITTRDILPMRILLLLIWDFYFHECAEIVSLSDICIYQHYASAQYAVRNLKKYVKMCFSSE